jgi:sensor histidine kinase regulating citrate/malate metabolism
VATIRDRTEIESLGSELETMRTLSDALRAQTHEHANRLHTLVSLLELGRGPEALDFATKDLELSQRLTDDVVSSIEEPVLGALIMGKVAEARERGVELDLNAGGSTAVSGLAVQDLVAILGNLLDNAIDAAAEAPAPKLVELTVANDGGSLEITVEDSGPGIDPAAVEDIFRHGFSTKEPGPFGRGLGLALVRQAVHRLGGTLTISSPAGALFHVMLPTATASAAPLSVATRPTATLPAAPGQAAEGQP